MQEDRYFIKEFILEENKAVGVFTVGNFSEEEERDKAFKKYFEDTERKGFVTNSIEE